MKVEKTCETYSENDIELEYDLSDKKDDYEAHKENKWDVLPFDREFMVMEIRECVGSFCRLTKSIT